MPEYHYEWEIILSAHGPNPEAAWDSCVDAVTQDRSWPMPSAPIYRELVDPDIDPDEPPDKTPIEKRPQDKKWLIWSNKQNCYCKSEGHGYSINVARAKRYSFKEAVEICREANNLKGDWRPQKTMVPED